VKRQPPDLVTSLSTGLRRAFDVIDAELEACGTAAEHDVKTIYISYMVDGQMAAAVYPRSQEIEVALALPEDHPSPALRDATHLTWRTMPVSVVVTDVKEARDAQPLIRESIERVRSGSHDVDRDNDYWVSRKRERSRP
jgi:predicted transport protein